MVIVIIHLFFFSYANYVHGILNTFFGQWKTSALNEPQPPLIKPRTNTNTHIRIHTCRQTAGCFFFVLCGDYASTTVWATVFTSINISTTRHNQLHGRADFCLYSAILHLIYFFSISLSTVQFHEPTLRVYANGIIICLWNPWNGGYTTHIHTVL